MWGSSIYEYDIISFRTPNFQCRHPVRSNAANRRFDDIENESHDFPFVQIRAHPCVILFISVRRLSCVVTHGGVEAVALDAGAAAELRSLVGCAHYPRRS